MTTIKCLVIPADEEQDIREHEYERGDLRAMQQLVGGTIAAIDIGEPEVTIWNNDEARLIDLPLNRRATLLWWCGDNRFVNVDALHGDVFLTGLTNEDGDETSVPQDFLELVLKEERYRYQILTFNGGDWSGNGLTFEDYWEAINEVLLLAGRWTLVQYTRIIAA